NKTEFLAPDLTIAKIAKVVPALPPVMVCVAMGAMILAAVAACLFKLLAVFLFFVQRSTLLLGGKLRIFQIARIFYTYSMYFATSSDHSAPQTLAFMAVKHRALPGCDPPNRLVQYYEQSTLNLHPSGSDQFTSMADSYQ
ncbi:MAG: hypothetical protein ACD_61C00168G0001, partial [uncultured bacterium]